MEAILEHGGGGGDDPAVLADVLAFLDAFDGDADAEREPRAVAANDGASPSPSSALHADKRTRRRRTPESHARYWKRKSEMQSLRNLVEYLTNVLEYAQRSGRDPRRLVSVTSRGVAERLRGRGWEQRAHEERARLEHALRNNAELRRLARSQKSSARAVNSLLDSAWSHAWKQSISKAEPLGYTEGVSWASACLANVAANSSSAWSTSFVIPSGNPRLIGAKWWHAVQNMALYPSRGAEPFSLGEKETASFVKQSVWSVRDHVHDQIDFKGQVTFDVSASDTQWTLALTAEVFVGSERTMLFRVTAVRTITRSRSAPASGCVFQAYYRVDDSANETHAQPQGLSEHDRQKQAQREYIKEVGVAAWARAMRQKDEHMRVLFGEIRPIQQQDMTV